MFVNGTQALCEWRDIVARAEDESTGYVLPNKILIEIGNSKTDTFSFSHVFDRTQLFSFTFTIKILSNLVT